MPVLKILLADDHPIVREGLKTLILTQPDMEVIGEASDGQQACQQASLLQPDLVIMDISSRALVGRRQPNGCAVNARRSKCWSSPSTRTKGISASYWRPARLAMC